MQRRLVAGERRRQRDRRRRQQQAHREAQHERQAEEPPEVRGDRLPRDRGRPSVPCRERPLESSSPSSLAAHWSARRGEAREETRRFRWSIRAERGQAPEPWRRSRCAIVRSGARGMSRRIAIVEDDAAIRANYADVLRRQGYDVAAYPDRPARDAGLPHPAAGPRGRGHRPRRRDRRRLRALPRAAGALGHAADHLPDRPRQRVRHGRRACASAPTTT